MLGTTAQRTLGVISRTIGSFMPAALLGIVFAWCGNAAPIHPPNVTGLEAEDAARVLAAAGLRVIGVGLTLAPDAPRDAEAQPAPAVDASAPVPVVAGCSPEMELLAPYLWHRRAHRMPRWSRSLSQPGRHSPGVSSVTRHEQQSPRPAPAPIRPRSTGLHPRR
jgi:hypothetical protein